MNERKAAVALKGDEQRLLVKGLMETRREMKERDGDAGYLEDLVLKVIDAGKAGKKRRDREAR